MPGSEHDKKLYAMFAEALDIPVEQVTEDGEHEFDSVAHMTLIAALDTHFGVTLSNEELLEANSVAAAREILQKHNVQF